LAGAPTVSASVGGALPLTSTGWLLSASAAGAAITEAASAATTPRDRTGRRDMMVSLITGWSPTR
jgi:hypothetical protein